MTSRWILLGMKTVLGKSCTDNNITYFMFNNLFFRKSFGLCDNVEKYGAVRQATWACVLHAGYKRLKTHIRNM